MVGKISRRVDRICSVFLLWLEKILCTLVRNLAGANFRCTRQTLAGNTLYFSLHTRETSKLCFCKNNKRRIIMRNLAGANFRCTRQTLAGNTLYFLFETKKPLVGKKFNEKLFYSSLPAVGGLRPGPAPAAARPAAATPHSTPPANNNRMEGRQMSCRQQPTPPPCDAAKMSPRISIGPEPVLVAHAPSPPAAGSHCPGKRRFQLPIAGQNL
jgi:hypothetical protein